MPFRERHERREDRESSLKTDFQHLENEQQLEALLESSHVNPQFVFKHSTRCSISSMALSRFEKGQSSESMPVAWYLDLIRFRHLSDALSQASGIQHESPQVLLFHQGRCVYHASHLAIRPEDLVAAVKDI
jgi:bacillithiol system protein YtxJ